MVWFRNWFLCGCACLWSGTLLFADEPRKLTFEEDVAPILEARCWKCHGEAQKKGNLDLRRRFTLESGGDSGPAYVAGKPDESVLIERIVEGSMPPKEEGALDARQLSLLKAWIESGAHIKGEKEPPLEVTDEVETVSDADRQFWSFQPPKRAETPTVANQSRVRTPIDAFLLQALEAKGLSFNPDADRLVLLRRLYFDLHGLPPTPEQIAAFLADERSDAYEQLVDQLLESPRYGERWARHWLDVAGYADSDGYLEADRERAEAWRYRDYVIQALNADKAYDRFLLEQLAGDEITDWRRADALTAEMKEALIATGFLRTAADPTYPGYKEKLECYKVMADTTQIVSSALMGLTLQCARCHAHKSDPFTQRDYYQLHAVFLASYDPARWLASSERYVPLASEPERARLDEHNRQVDQRVAQLTADGAAFKQELLEPLIAAKLAAAFEGFEETLAQAETTPAWSYKFDGTANGWKTRVTEQGLVVENITGKPGYATVKLSRPVSLAGDFEMQFGLAWNSKDETPAQNTAMQVVLLNLRDSAGNLVAAHGYVDENNNKRGSPVGGIALGPDVIDHYLKLYQQAAPPDEFAHSLGAAGQAKVTVSRDAEGLITSTFDDSVRPHVITGTSKAVVTQIEIEVRRFILEPGATFEGVTLQAMALKVGPGSVVPAETRELMAAALKVAADKRSEEQKKLLAEKGPTLVIDDAELTRRDPEYVRFTADLKKKIAEETAQKQSFVQLRALQDLDDKPADAHVLRRGDFNNLGAKVEAGLPAVLVSAGDVYRPEPGYKTTGRRKAFAEWLINPEHPLTARVQVNRIWAQHFGRGIVPTLDQFGHSGEKPSHPELLDWLATEFIRIGWSQKQLHRLILTSTVYRQTSDFSADKAAIDPDDVLLWAWRPRRIEAESLRDAVLDVAGQLNPQMFGAPVGVVRMGDGQVVEAGAAEGRRRSIYLKVRRSQPLTLLELFDSPRMEVNCPQRTEAIVATQALTLSNSKFIEENANLLAQRVLTNAGEDENSRIQAIWKYVLSREPTVTEQAAVTEFLDRAVKAELGDLAAVSTPAERQKARDQSWTHVAQALLNSNEFLYVH